MRFNRRISNWQQAAGVVYAVCAIGTLIGLAFEPTAQGLAMLGLLVFVAMRLWAVGCQREAAAQESQAAPSE